MREWIWVSSSEIDYPRASYTEWISSKEKNKYPILRHIYGIEKNRTNEPACRAAAETQI